jgi:hypothetical protein
VKGTLSAAAAAAAIADSSATVQIVERQIVSLCFTKRLQDFGKFSSCVGWKRDSYQFETT